MEVNDSTRVKLSGLLECKHFHTLVFTLFTHKPRAAFNLDSFSLFQAILLSSDGQNLVTGGDNGVVEVWQACDFKQLYIYPGCDAGIRAMDLSHDQR